MWLQNFSDIEKCFHDIKPNLRCHTTTKTNEAIPSWNTTTIVWLIVFNRIRLSKATIPNHVDTSEGEGDSDSVYSGFNI